MHILSMNTHPPAMAPMTIPQINIYIGKQEYTANLFEAFSPVVTWFTIRMVPVRSIINKWITRQLDIFLDFSQTNIEFNMCMEIPHGIGTNRGIKKITYSSSSIIYMDIGKDLQCGTRISPKR